MILLLISFIAGVLTVLAPCILPLLPVIVGGSLTGEGRDAQKRKVLTIVLALGLSVIAFTLLLKASTLFIAIPEYVWKWLSGGIIIVLGLVTVFPSLWEGAWLARLSTKSNILLGKGSQKNSFWGDVLMGAALGPVFSTCSPTYFIVLATVLPSQPVVGFIYLLTYTAGLCLSLFAIAFVGQRIMTSLNIAADPRGLVKRSLGVLFLIVGIAIITGLDKRLETSIINAGVFDVTKIEQSLLKHLPKPEEPMPTASVPATPLSLSEKRVRYSAAPELVAPDAYLNTAGVPITMEQYRGKSVVLIDFWTYSCINCQRTTPYLNAWHDKYKDQGLVIVGVHTPEFAFERLEKNVAKALTQMGIEYPVVLDNEFRTWNAYRNHYWPHKYLVDIDGFVIYDHIGEGGYAETEKAIQAALAERASRLDAPMPETPVSISEFPAPDFARVQSPETYFGANRNQTLANGTRNAAGEQSLTLPPVLMPNKLYLGGVWRFDPEYAENISGDAKIGYYYSATNLYFVGSGIPSGTRIEIFQDGAPIGLSGGADVIDGAAVITESRLYHLVRNHEAGAHQLELRIKSPGLKAYTFTFG